MHLPQSGKVEQGRQMTMDEGEHWYIANGTSVLIASPDDSPLGVSFEFHQSSAVGEAKTRADLLVDAFTMKARCDPQWAADLIAWRLDQR